MPIDTIGLYHFLQPSEALIFAEGQKLLILLLEWDFPTQEDNCCLTDCIAQKKIMLHAVRLLLADCVQT